METISQNNSRKEYLYHGTSSIEGDTIRLRSNTGVGWNSWTLGNGFYMTNSIYAAKLFGHLAEQKAHLLNQNIDPLERINQANTAGTGKVYILELRDAKILNAKKPLDVNKAKELLIKADIRTDIIRSFEHNLSEYNIVANLLSHSKQSVNPHEFIVKQLGYDGLRITEGRWKRWDYYPEHLGLGFNKFKDTPETVILYSVEKVASFKEYLLLCERQKQAKQLSVVGNKTTVQKRRLKR